MVKLKFPLNYRGILIEAGTTVGSLPAELQEKLIKSGAAERVQEAVIAKVEKPIDKMTKSELLEVAAKLGIPGISEDMTKAEIIEAMAAHQEEKSPGKDDNNGTQKSDTV